MDCTEELLVSTREQQIDQPGDISDGHGFVLVDIGCYGAESLGFLEIAAQQMVDQYGDIGNAYVPVTVHISQQCRQFKLASIGKIEPVIVIVNGGPMP